MAELHHTVFGDDLALLSLKVAVQIDRKFSGKSVDQSTFADFGNELSKTTGVAGPTPAAASYLQANPRASEVLASAIRETSKRQVSDTAELASAVSDILGKIEKFNAINTSPEDLSKIKLFCLSLHKSMMSQKLPPSFEGETAFEDRLGILR